MSRGYTADHVRSLHEKLSGSVVELVAFRRNNHEVAHLGTGVIVYYDDALGRIGIITTISCNPEEYRVVAGFAGQKNLETEFVLKGTFLSELVISGYNGAVGVVPVTSDDSFEENPERSEPVWTVGCFADNLEEIMPGVDAFLETANVNFGVRFEELKKELAKLAEGANSEESMSSLLGKFRKTLLRKWTKKSDAGPSPKKTQRSDAGPFSKKARKT